jgi:hypothetical protein
MELDGGKYMSPGRVYRSENEYEEYKKADDDWRVIRDVIGTYGRPKWITPEAVNELLAVIEKYKIKNNVNVP